MRRGGIGRCDTYYDLLESHGRTDRGSGSWSPAVRCHPERQRRISVRVVSDAIGRNYHSAGRLTAQQLVASGWGAPDGAGSRIEDRDRGVQPSAVILSRAKDLGKNDK